MLPLFSFGLVLLFLIVKVECNNQINFNETFILTHSPKCKVASDCKTSNSGCASGNFKGVDLSICFSCDEAKQVKSYGLTIDGCTGSTGSSDGSSALPIVAVVICVILLVVAGIALALCFLKPNCALYKWNLKRKNAGGQGQGDLQEVAADQSGDNISSKTNEVPKPVGSDTKGAGERIAAGAGPRRPKKAGTGRPNRAAAVSASASALPAPAADDAPPSGNNSKTKTNQKPKGAGSRSGVGGRPKAKAKPSPKQ